MNASYQLLNSFTNKQSNCNTQASCSHNTSCPDRSAGQLFCSHHPKCFLQIEAPNWMPLQSGPEPGNGSDLGNHKQTADTKNTEKGWYNGGKYRQGPKQYSFGFRESTNSLEELPLLGLKLQVQVLHLPGTVYHPNQMTSRGWLTWKLKFLPPWKRTLLRC